VDNVIIRKMTAADIPAVEVLYRQYWNEKSNVEKMAEKFAQVEPRDDYVFFCAEQDDKIVATVMGIVCEELYGDALPFLLAENMVVDPACRRQGVGRLIFDALEDWGRSKGCRQVLLLTESNREDARAFYTSIGFHPTANAGFKKKLY